MIIKYFSCIEYCFNTQPPEGGWKYKEKIKTEYFSFNTQPPEGGWQVIAELLIPEEVSTHSRPKAADLPEDERAAKVRVSTHSRPKAAD